MLEKKYLRNVSIMALSTSLLALSACSTSGASRYADEQNAQRPAPCGPVMVHCGQVIEHYAVTVQPPAYLVPAPCPIEQCPPQPVVVQPTYEPPVVVEPPYEPPVAVEPYYEPPVVVIPPYEPPVVPYEPPVISCPEGTIPGYGGQDCIQITVPRK